MKKASGSRIRGGKLESSVPKGRELLMRIATVLMLIGFSSAFSYCEAHSLAVKDQKIVVGKVRVSLISDSLVRLEMRGPHGFEDRNTFHVLDRSSSRLDYEVRSKPSEIVIETAHFVVKVPSNAASLDEVRIETPDGISLYKFEGKLANSVSLPSPSEKPLAFAFADSPRFVHPWWGLTPAPKGADNLESNGWDLANDAPDIYVFLPRGDYRRLRKDFLQVTGPTAMPPLYTFGAWDSRWYNYNEASALAQIEAYRSHRIPLDVLVVDTGWREGASIGYAPNKDYFPDVKRFLSAAHDQNVRVMFNDHPEPRSPDPLSKTELDFRFDSLSNLLEQGLDIWWFDRNWMVALNTPKSNMRKEVWGMRMYHDMTQRARPDERPLIMSNADGIDNGFRNNPPNVASHRFAIQWTGDTSPGLDSLRRGVENCVYSGVADLIPYLSEDLGGHTSNPTSEGYIRWTQYGALSPVYRPHGTYGLERMPWSFGERAEAVVRRFLGMRYRLMPTWYSASRENYESGEPVLRRLDLDYPGHKDAERNDQYLIGKNILVAPIFEEQSNQKGKSQRALWIPPGVWIDAWTGETTTGPKLISKTCTLDQIPVYIRAGGLIMLAPHMQHTGEKPWSPVTLDIYPSGDASDRVTLYEDDGHSTAYRNGAFRKTNINSASNSSGRSLVVEIGPSNGTFVGAMLERSWVLRVHKPIGWADNLVPSGAKLNGDQVIVGVKRLRNASAMPLGDAIGSPDSTVYEFTLPISNVDRATRVEVEFVSEG